MSDSRIEQLKQLPQRPEETWQGGLVRLPGWIMEEGQKPFRAIGAVWGSLRTGKVGTGQGGRRKDEVNFAMAVDSLVDFATGQHAGYRPGKLQVNNPALAEHLSGLLAEAGTRVEYRPRLLMVERCLEDMSRFLSKGRPVPPGYLQGKGVTLERVRTFAEAAREFYTAAPWQHLNNEDLIEIESPRGEPALRFAVVLGAGRQTYGLGFYKSVEEYWDSRDCDPRQRLLVCGGAWELTFDDVTFFPLPDADLWEDHGLPLAGETAYPTAIHFDPYMRPRRPGADVLAFFEGLMRALALTTEKEMDSGRWTKQVTTFNGAMEYVLSLPFLLKPPDHRDLFDHGISDRRAMEAMNVEMDRFLEGEEFASAEEMTAAINEEFAGRPPDRSRYAPRGAADEAQDLCFQAFDAIGRRRIALARKATHVWPDCADAYVILAECAYSPENAGELYAAGAEAGRRALGEQFFAENAGRFWGISRTRPFMRALVGMAQTQGQAGRLAEAIGGYQELLRLNPNDNQGARYLLLPLLLAQGRLDESRRLIADFPQDAMAVWPYCRALLTFATEGDTPAARGEILEAIEANPHVPKYLLGEAEFGGAGDYTLGSDEEAVLCAQECGPAWRSIPGALDWLRAQAQRPRITGGKRRHPKGR